MAISLFVFITFSLFTRAQTCTRTQHTAITHSVVCTYITKCLVNSKIHSMSTQSTDVKSIYRNFLIFAMRKTCEYSYSRYCYHTHTHAWEVSAYRDVTAQPAPHELTAFSLSRRSQTQTKQQRQRQHQFDI